MTDHSRLGFRVPSEDLPTRQLLAINGAQSLVVRVVTHPSQLAIRLKLDRTPRLASRIAVSRVISDRITSISARRV